MSRRCFDLLMSMAGITLFVPLFLVIALLVFLEDGGPVFFTQWRLGRHRKHFQICKFRTMKDGQVTRVGRWLRHSGLDEIPQFFNILRGQMSVVGPRPLTPDDVKRLGWHRAYYDVRWHGKPGLTGLAQLYAGRSAKLSWLFDRTYAEKPGAVLDAQIIALSFAINLVGKTRMRRWLRNRRKNANARCLRLQPWPQWQQFFEARKERPLPMIDANGWNLQLPPSVARSLAVFQLGESGGGTVVAQVRRSSFGQAHPAYASSMELFVREEHRHAEILAMCVHALGGQLIHSNWTDRLFVMTRRAMGVRLKVLVLLAAEVVGLSYYRLIAQSLPPSQLRSLLEELCADEQAHLQFHCDFFRSQTPGAIRKLVFSVLWYSVTGLALMAVYIDHRRVLSDMCVPRKELLMRWKAHVELAIELVVCPANAEPRLQRFNCQ